MFGHSAGWSIVWVVWLDAGAGLAVFGNFCILEGDGKILFNGI